MDLITWSDLRPNLSPELIDVLNQQLKLPNVMQV